MALQSSGLIRLSQIQTEFGGSNPISLSEYYRGGAYTTTNNTGVPTSGSISLSNFYGTVGEFSFTISSNTQEANLSTLATAAGWDGVAPVVATVASGVYLWSDDTTIPGLLINVANCTVTNNGYIIGKGGSAGGGGGGAGGDGGSAINVSASGVTLVNSSGAYIAGGGGAGGGTNGGGGAGGGDSASPVVGGAVGQEGEDATTVGTGGGAGGGGGALGETGTSSGGGGGRILPGVGGSGAVSNRSSGGNGGSAGNAGGQASTGYYTYVVAGTTYYLAASGGGGGWGAAGGAGRYQVSPSSGNFTTYLPGAGGAAISGTSPSLTNNGTIYGSTV